MKHRLGAVALLAVLTACSSGSDESAKDPASTPPTSVTSGDAEVVAIVGGSAAGGDQAQTVTVLDSAHAVRGFLKQFRSPSFAADVRAALEAHPPADGRVLGAAVVEVSCDIPPSATVAEVDGSWVVTPGKVPSPHPECYAAVTSVAVVDLPA
jgi:hypothetical protein